MICVQYFKSIFGELIIGSYEEKLVLCDWRYRKMRPTIDKRIQTGLKAEYVEQESDTISKTSHQLKEYFQGQRREFELPTLCVGTDFQKIIWNRLVQIKYGETKSYLELANEINNKEAIRAVASANGANAISIIIPCHRVIGSSGELTGYAGGIDVKEKLLVLEGSIRKAPLQLSLEFERQ